MKKYIIEVEVVGYENVEVYAENEDEAYDKVHDIMDESHYDSYDIVDIIGEEE